MCTVSACYSKDLKAKGEKETLIQILVAGFWGIKEIPFPLVN
jgi:hypothetical protein